MHAASSVSELYAADEVELLLDEIRGLEPTSCRPEELQDLEIAGSGCAGWGGASPGTERSWDSHAQYRRRGVGAALHLAPVYCGWRRGGAAAAAGVLAAGAAAAAAALALAAAGRGASAAPVSLAPPVRALQLAALTSAALHTALVFAQVSRLADLLPVHWHRLTACVCVWSVCSLSGSGAATLLKLPPPDQVPVLFSAAVLAVCGAVFALGLLFVTAWSMRRGARDGGGGGGSGGGSGGFGGAHHYRAVPAADP